MDKCTVFDLRSCQFAQDRGIPRYLYNLMSQLSIDNPNAPFYFMFDRNFKISSFLEKFRPHGHFFFVDEGTELFDKKHITNYFVCWFVLKTETQNFFETLFPSFLIGHAPRILGIIWDVIPLVFSDKYLNMEHKTALMCSYVATREADHLFAISDHTAKDAVQFLNISKDKITNIYGGVSPEILDMIKQIPTQEEKLVFSFGSVWMNKYFVYIGGEDWRKNLSGLIKAYGIYLANTPCISIEPLVIICTIGNDTVKHLKKLIKESHLIFNKHIFIAGYVTDIDLVRLLKNAKASIFPSLYEGLGLPILESYACNTPVLASNTSSMLEIVHPDCLFDPYDPQNIADKIQQFCQDPNLGKISLEFGSTILNKFTWKNASTLITNQLIKTN